MMKLLKTILAFLLLYSISYASQITPFYNLEIPATGDRDWTSVISKDIVSIDVIAKVISNDFAYNINQTIKTTSTPTFASVTATNKLSCDYLSIDAYTIMSADGVSTIGGIVGRIRVVSPDGTFSYIPIYAGS